MLLKKLIALAPATKLETLHLQDDSLTYKELFVFVERIVLETTRKSLSENQNRLQQVFKKIFAKQPSELIFFEHDLLLLVDNKLPVQIEIVINCLQPNNGFIFSANNEELLIQLFLQTLNSYMNLSPIYYPATFSVKALNNASLDNLEGKLNYKAEKILFAMFDNDEKKTPHLLNSLLRWRIFFSLGMKEAFYLLGKYGAIMRLENIKNIFAFLRKKSSGHCNLLLAKNEDAIRFLQDSIANNFKYLPDMKPAQNDLEELSSKATKILLSDLVKFNERIRPILANIDYSFAWRLFFLKNLIVLIKQDATKEPFYFDVDNQSQLAKLKAPWYRLGVKWAWVLKLQKLVFKMAQKLAQYKFFMLVANYLESIIKRNNLLVEIEQQIKNLLFPN